jgi:hypothetical protein
LKYLRRLTSIGLASSLSAFALLGAGCSGEDAGDDAEAADAALREVSACSASAGYRPCDVLDPACQSLIAEIAACQWGGAGTPPILPPVTTLTQDELRNYFTDSTVEAMIPEESTAYDDVLTLFGLIEAGMLSSEASIERAVDGVLALYQPEDKTIILVDRGEEPEAGVADSTLLGLADSTLLHELIHAQQDAAHDLLALDASVTPTADGITAYQSLVEGEAQFHTTLFLMMLARLPVTALGVESIFDRTRDAEEDVRFMLPNVLPNTLDIMPYIYGPSWVLATWTGDGRQALQARYEDIPTDTLEMLRASWNTGRGSVQATPFPLDLQYSIGGEMEPVSRDRLGAYGVYLTARHYGSAAAARDLALGWRGDQIESFSLDAGGSAGRWIVTFDSPEHAFEFESILGAAENVSPRLDGATLVAAVATGGEIPEWVYGPLAAP